MEEPVRDCGGWGEHACCFFKSKQRRFMALFCLQGAAESDQFPILLIRKAKSKATSLRKS
jgi:hypothetical protein